MHLFLLSFLHVACHSSNSHYLNSCGLFSKSDKLPSSLHSPIEVVNYSCINCHKAQLHSRFPHPLKNPQQCLTAYSIKCETCLATSMTYHQQTKTYLLLTISQNGLFNHLLIYPVYSKQDFFILFFLKIFLESYLSLLSFSYYFVCISSVEDIYLDMIFIFIGRYILLPLIDYKSQKCENRYAQQSTQQCLARRRHLVNNIMRHF